MDIGISTGLFYKQRVNELLPLIKKAGFEMVEIWDGGEEWGADCHFNHHDEKQIKALQDALWFNHVKAMSMHGPFGEKCDISVFDDQARQRAISEVIFAVDTAAKIGAKILVTHPGNKLAHAHDAKERDRRIEISIESLKIISREAKSKNVRLAVENMLGGMVGGEAWQIERILASLDQEIAGMCLDVSHASLCKELDKYFKTFGSRIFAVHVSDNHGKLDDHLIPGEGILDFVSIARKLKEIKFRGVFLLEILGEAVHRKPEEVLKSTRAQAHRILKEAGV